MNLEKLQNGSDIRGIAISTEEYKANLTTKEVKEIAKGAVSWFRSKNEDNNSKYLAGDLLVGIGRDSRITGPELKDALVESFIQQGVNVIDFGLATTPAMFMATQFEEFDCDFTIMLTASHLPYYFNGLKFFDKTGGAEKSDIKEILSSASAENSNGKTGVVEEADLLTPYAKDMVEKIITGAGGNEKPLAGLKVIVDAGNGAGGFFAEKVVKELGGDITGSQFLEPDGTFPNHIPNPDNKEAMEAIKSAVLNNKADLGIIFDTDVDRSALVTATGDLLNRNNLIAVLSHIVLDEYPHTSIVTNSPTSSHLKTFIESLGGKQVRYISGYRNVINKAIDLNSEGVETHLAIETSGHAAFKENYFLDDGAYVVAKIFMLLPKLTEEGRSLSDLIENLNQPSEVQEVRFKLEDDDYRKLGERVILDIDNADVAGFKIDTANHEGVRFNTSGKYGSGWFLLRMSLHEPLLVLQVENDEPGKVKLVLEDLKPFFDQYPNVNKEKLNEVLLELNGN